MNRLADDLALALRMADDADALSMARFGARDLDISTKPDASHVTDADFDVERRLVELLARERPDDAVLGEEFGEVAGTEPGSESARRQWIIDPIDGTAHFLRVAPFWSTLIALAVDGKPALGVVSSPAMRARWWAAAGGGAWKQESGGEPRRIHVSGVDSLADAAFSYNSLQRWELAGRLDDLLALQREVWVARSYGDAPSYMLLAEGALDAVAEFDLKPYDMAALIPVIEEAGGTFTSMEGESGPWHGSALATNGRLHAELLSRLKHE